MIVKKLCLNLFNLILNVSRLLNFRTHKWIYEKYDELKMAVWKTIFRLIYTCFIMSYSNNFYPTFY